MTLIGYWPLNEESGNTAYDYSGNENHGSLEGSPTQGVNGVVSNTAYDFDGESDYVAVASDDLKTWWNSRESITVSYWLKTDTDDRTDYITQHRTSTQSFILQFNQSGQLASRMYAQDASGSDWDLETDVPVLDNEWHLFTLVIHSFQDNYGQWYVDGEPVNQSSSTNGSVDWDDMERPLSIGARVTYDGSVQRHLDGSIQELRIWDRALSPSEVQYLYNVAMRGRFSSRKKSP